MDKLQDIKLDSSEGQYLMAALAVITSESQKDKTPNEVLGQLKKLVTIMFSNVHDTPPPGDDDTTVEEAVGTIAAVAPPLPEPEPEPEPDSKELFDEWVDEDEKYASILANHCSKQADRARQLAVTMENQVTTISVLAKKAIRWADSGEPLISGERYLVRVAERLDDGTYTASRPVLAKYGDDLFWTVLMDEQGDSDYLLEYTAPEFIQIAVTK